MIAPSTGDLWWTTASETDDAGTLYYSPVSNGAPTEASSVSPGVLGGFTPSGQPSPYNVAASPSGSSLAVIFSAPINGNDVNGDDIVIGSPASLTGACLQAAYNASGTSIGASVSIADVVQSCPGVAGAELPCAGFVGLVSDTLAACTTANNALETVPFSTSGSVITFGTAQQLTPPTQQTISSVELSPDGKTIWFIAQQQSGSEAEVYQVPTSTPTENPQGFNVTLSTPSGVEWEGVTSTLGNAGAVGWYWKGKFINV
jgi:hypothetical protein